MFSRSEILNKSPTNYVSPWHSRNLYHSCIPVHIIFQKTLGARRDSERSERTYEHRARRKSNSNVPRVSVYREKACANERTRARGRWNTAKNGSSLCDEKSPRVPFSMVSGPTEGLSLSLPSPANSSPSNRINAIAWTTKLQPKTIGF